MVNKIATPPTTSELIGTVNEIIDGKQDVLTAGTDLEIVGYAPTTVSGNGSVSLNNAIANGLISVTLTGGCEQNGTPTPTNPVDIICNNGAIKYSKNIFDKTLNAATGSASRYWEIQVPNGTYTCSTDIPKSGGSANVWFDIQPVFSSNVNPVYASQPRTITVTEGVLYVAVRSGSFYDSLMSGERWVQVEQGNTATTYHPYGIYIDGNIETISDGNSNTAIAEYLLSVGDYKDTQELLSGEITRNVGIKVLDGTEPWFYNNSGGNSVFYSNSIISTNVFGVPPYSNRYIGITSASGRTDGNIYIININNSSRLDVVDNRFTNATDWKAYLSEQYYAGNPVIVVYAIGDSTSETAQAQTLTTQKGSNTISITQASVNNLPVSVNYNMSGTTVINFTNETGYTSFSEIKDKLAYYGTCTTDASTQNKIVDCNGFELSEGVSIRIKFTNAQTYNGQPTLNVNNTGAIGIALRSDTEGIRYMWQAGDVIEFTYDGTSWIWERGGVATTTYYGVTKLTSSATTSSASLSLTASSLNGFSRDMVSGAQTYSTSTTYAVGDRVRYQYKTWECTSPTTGTWDKNSWTALDPLQIQVDGKQDTLVSGTNIKTINNTSILGSGNIDIQGGGGAYTAGDGIDITNDVISVTNAISTGAALGATAVQPSDLATVATSGSYSDLTNIPTNLLKNTATASSALTISGIATDKNGAINIGTSSQATGSYGVSIGAYSYANGSLALGLGYSARATADYAIQLGQGTNSTASTLYVGFNTRNYLLLDGTTGLIPDARLSSNILRSADLSGYATENWVNNQGYLTGITSSDVTSALGYTPYNATNPNGYITSSALNGYALDTDVVHKTGTETIAGEKTFTSKLRIDSGGIEITPELSASHGGYIDFHYAGSTDDYTSRIIENNANDLSIETTHLHLPLSVSMKDTGITKGTTPSSNHLNAIYWTDVNGVGIGHVYNYYRTNKENSVRMQVSKMNSASDTDYTSIGVVYPASGNPYGFCPASDVNGSIVTTVNKSKSANGYFELGNGLIIQWGRISITANNATGSVTFPKAFTSTNYSITAAGRRSAGSGQGEISITETYSTTGFSWRSNATASYYNNQQFWIAIGY
jgi:hypothetical protein